MDNSAISIFLFMHLNIFILLCLLILLHALQALEGFYENFDSDFIGIRTKAREVLQREDDLNEIVQVPHLDLWGSGVWLILHSFGQRCSNSVILSYLRFYAICWGILVLNVDYLTPAYLCYTSENVFCCSLLERMRWQKRIRLRWKLQNSCARTIWHRMLLAGELGDVLLALSIHEYSCY